MGVLIRWKVPAGATSYTNARIYRSDSQSGSYSLVGSVGISENQYYDSSGTTSHWYKVDFYDNVTQVVSSLSDPIQGGDINAYCSIDDVRTVSNITSNDLTDTQICNLIQFAAYQVNADVQKLREEERVSYINIEKENDIDGINVTFYTRNYPIGDLNNDFEVNENDIEVYTIGTDGTRTTYTVSSLDNASIGKFTLATAPGSDEEVYIKYYSATVDMQIPHPLVKIANALFAASWAYMKLNIGKASRFRTPALTVFRDMDSHRTFYRKYIEVITEINAKGGQLAGFVTTPSLTDYIPYKTNSCGGY